MSRSRNLWWLNALARSLFPARPARQRRRSVPLRLEPLEDRVTPTAYTVTIAGDSSGSAGGSGSGTSGDLRYCISQAIADGQNDTITFDRSLAGATIALGSSLVSGPAGFANPYGQTAFIVGASDNITIDGSNAPGLTINGGNATRLFAVEGGGMLQLENLTLSGGHAQGGEGGGGSVGGGGGGGLGGAVLVDGSTFTAQGCTFVNNQATGGGGGAGGVFGDVFYGNGGGGGLGGGGGDGLSVGAPAPTLRGGGGGGLYGGAAGTSSHFSGGQPGGFGGGGGGAWANNGGGLGGFGGGGGGGNAYGRGGFGGGGGGQGGGGSNGFGGFGGGNGGGGGGGGGAGFGGAIFSNGGSLTLTNDTFTANTATGGGGGLGNVGSIFSGNGDAGQGDGGAVFARNGTLTATFVTFSGNSVTNGDGTAGHASDVYVLSDASDGGNGTSPGSGTATATLVDDVLGPSGFVANTNAGGAAPVFTIINSTPTAQISVDPNATQAPDKANLFLTATDTQSQALAPGFTYTINWGDGTNPQTIGATANNGGGVSVSHTYATDGSYLVSVSATDTNGAISTAATGLVVASSKTGDSIAVSGGASAGQVAVSVDNAAATTFSPTDLVLVTGQGGNDTFTANFGSTLTTRITFAGSGSDTLNANGSSDSTLSNYIVKNGTAQTITWGTTAGQTTESVGYSGIQNVNLYGGAGPNYITDPGSNTTIYGGPGANTIVITATTGNGVTIHGGGSDTYVVNLGNLAGPVSIQNSNAGATDNLIVNGATGNNTITAAGNQITEGTQTITDTAALANLTVNGGSGNNQLTVSSLTVPVQNVILAGGGGTNTYNVNAGTVNIVAGTGVNVLNVTGGTVASITAPVGDSKPLVFAHIYTVLANGTLSVAANGVLADDVSANSQPLTAVLATGPAHGTVTVNANGSFTYTPSSNFVGVDTFTYQAKGSDGTLSVPATVTIQVTYKFSGFLPPLSQGMAYAVNRTIPIKFQLTDASGKAITSLSAVTALQIFNSQGKDVLGGSGLAGLSVTGGQYSYNWQTKGLTAGQYTISVTLADGTTQTKTIQLTAGGSSAGLVTDGSTGTATAGALLGGEVDLYVDNSNGYLTSDELARIQDAVNAVDTTIAPYGVVINEVTDPTQANVTLNMNTTSSLGGTAQGVLGCTTDADQVTMIQGWNWYAGSDPTQVGTGQYDFETAVMHELGHVLGLGHSSSSTSVMYASLATGMANHALVTADLNVPDSDSGPCALHAAPAAVVSSTSNSPSVPAPNSTSIPSSGSANSGSPMSATDQLFANFTLVLNEMRNGNQPALSSVAALWQSIDALALQRLNALLSLEAGAVGMSKDSLQHELLLASMFSSNRV